MNRFRFRCTMKAAVATFALLGLMFSGGAQAEKGYTSPCAVAAHADSGALYVADATSNQVFWVDLQSGKVKKKLELDAPAHSLTVSPDGSMLFVSAGHNPGKVVLIDLPKFEIKESIATGYEPAAIALSPDFSALYVCNQFDNTVAVYPKHEHQPAATIAVPREPNAAALTADGKWLVVANLLPAGASDGAYTAAHVSVIDTAQRTVAADIQLPNGSSSLRGVCVSPDGKYAYVAHVLSRYQLPTTQLERGWMNTNAFSVVDMEKKVLVNTVLLDSVDLGAANPWGVACSPDGALLCITHAGTHELSVIDRSALHTKLDKVAAGEAVSEVSQKASDVPNDLSFLVDLRRRVALTGKGPRALAIVGKHAYVAGYFSATVDVVDLDNTARPLQKPIELAQEPKKDPVRWGEELFFDATLCFQHWQSCGSCHPGTRVDALNWDLLNDGMGNPKNTKSLVLTHETPPAMLSGVRESAEKAVRAGIRHILFAVRPDEEGVAMDEYLKSLKPMPSPRLVNGELSEAAKRGKVVFEKADCADCHTGDKFTDLQLHDVGTARGLDAGKPYDTSTLRELWRTAPYLSDGRAATLKDVVTTCNPEDKHGLTKALNPQEIDDLVEFMLSL